MINDQIERFTDMRKVRICMRILMLNLDTLRLRPDHLGCYGYSRKTSLAIDFIAKNVGSLCRRAVLTTPEGT
jgi:hypothetical protein